MMGEQFLRDSDESAFAAAEVQWLKAKYRRG
jgi:hypothetical protein